jgi:hypothetical protein
MTAEYLAQFSVELAGGLAILFITSLFNTWVRNNIWKPLARKILWLFTLRITTTGRDRARTSEVNKLHAEIAALRASVESGKVAAQADLDSLHARVADANAVNEKRHATEIANAHERGRDAGVLQERALVQSQRSSAGPRPNWRVKSTGFGNTYLLSNTQPGAFAINVSISPLLNNFALTGQTQWAGKPSFTSESFTGERVGSLPVTFVVSWENELGDLQNGRALLAREPSTPIVGT